MEDKIKRKVKEYLKKAEPLFENLEIVSNSLQLKENIKKKNVGKVFYEMAICYYKDAKHFFDKEEYENALASLEYAEGWLDAGKLLGILKEKSERENGKH